MCWSCLSVRWHLRAIYINKSCFVKIIKPMSCLHLPLMETVGDCSEPGPKKREAETAGRLAPGPLQQTGDRAHVFILRPGFYFLGESTIS
jgi:hypothetical protein